MVTDIEPAVLDPKNAIETAEREFAQENMRQGVERLKTKLRERARAKAILDNIDREIADLKTAIEQGN